MSGQLGELVVSLSADIARFQADMGKAHKTSQETAQNIAKEMSRATDQIQTAFSGMSKILGGTMAILAGGAMFKDMIGTSKEVAGEITKLKVSLGISAQEASVLRVALDDVFLSADDMASAAGRITKQLVKNEEAFRNLGVSTRDNNNNFRSTVEIMSETNSKLMEFKEGTDRNVEGMKIYGKGWDEARKTLKLTSEAMEEGKKRAEELHLVFGDSGLKAIKDYKLAMKDIDDVAESVKVQIGMALIPELTRLAVVIGDSSVKGIPSFINGLHSVQAEIMRLAMLVDKAGGTLTTMGYYGSGGKFTETGRWWKEQNEMYRQRYETTEKELQALANLEVGLDKNGNPITAKKDKNSPNKRSLGAIDEKEVDLLNSYIGEWNRLQDKINEMNPYVSDFQREVNKVNAEYDTLIGKYPKFSSELERNRNVMLEQVKIVKDHKDALQEMSDVYQLELQDQAKAYDDMSQRYQLFMQDQEKMYQETSDRYQEVLMEQEALKKTSPWLGLTSGLEDYQSSLNNTGDMMRQMSESTFQGMEQMFTQFTISGKLRFKDFANTAIAELARIQMKMMVSLGMKAVSSIVGMFAGGGGDATGGGLVDAGGGYTGTSIYGQMASFDVGTPYVPSDMIAKIHKGEAIIPASQNRAGGNEMSVVVKIENKSSQEVKGKQGETQFDGKSYVIGVILEDVQNNGPLRGLMAGVR